MSEDAPIIELASRMGVESSWLATLCTGGVVLALAIATDAFVDPPLRRLLARLSAARASGSAAV